MDSHRREEIQRQLQRELQSLRYELLPKMDASFRNRPWGLRLKLGNP